MEDGFFESPCWVLLDENGDTLGRDSASGGYPYVANDIPSICFFASYEEAKKYADVNWEAHKPANIVMVSLTIIGQFKEM